MSRENLLTQKATIALDDLTTNGGLLNAEQNNQFIRNLVDQDTVLRMSRVVPMNAPQMKINKIGFASNIMRPASQDPAADTAMYDGRTLKPAFRSKPTTSFVELNTKEVIADIEIPYEVLEDNIEQGGLQNTILALINAKIAEELENLALNGDLNATAGVDPWLDYMDGWLALAQSHLYDASAAPVSAGIFNETIKTLPTKYRSNRNAMRFITSMDVESDYRLAVSNRGTGLGDAILTGTQALPVFGVPMVGAAFQPNTNILFTNPRNLIFGVQRNIRLETDRVIRERHVVIVVTMRIAFGVEEADAIVQVTNLG